MVDPISREIKGKVPHLPEFRGQGRFPHRTGRKNKSRYPARVESAFTGYLLLGPPGLSPSGGLVQRSLETLENEADLSRHQLVGG